MAVKAAEKKTQKPTVTTQKPAEKTDHKKGKDAGKKK